MQNIRHAEPAYLCRYEGECISHFRCDVLALVFYMFRTNEQQSGEISSIELHAWDKHGGAGVTIAFCHIQDAPAAS